MDPNEIISHAPDLLKGGAALAGALKLTEIVKAMLGPATAEFAERLRDDVRLYRYGRQLECLKKAEQMATDAGFTPKAVPIKILFPLLEGVSLEEDENLHTMWAALLANAASPDTAKVRAGFIAILRQMEPDEAALLNLIAQTKTSTFGRSGLTDFQLGGEYESFGFSRNKLGECLDALEAARLVHKAAMQYPVHYDTLLANRQYEPRPPSVMDEEGPYFITERGSAFAQACHPPQPKPKT